VKLRQRVLLLFAGAMALGAMALGASILYFVSRDVLLSSFRQLETEQMRQDVGSVVAALDGEHLRLGNTTDDYAYWDQMYNFMADPQKGDISGEFQNSQMEGLGLDLIAILDTNGTIVFAKVFDRQKHQEAPVP
jgi:sensor domain CHASE-containing protein